MKSFLPAFVVLIALVFAGCGPSGPPEDEVKSKFIGEYCGPDRHKLVLKEDGSYVNQRTTKSAFTGSPLLEKCEGKFHLEQDGSNWVLVLEESTENSSIMVKCPEARITVWEKEGGYIVGDSLPEITEMMDGVKVKMGDCL